MLISRLDFHHIHELKAYSTERLRAIRAAAVAATDASDQEKEALALIGEQLERDDDPTQLVFTTANWATPQTVTVTAVDDAVVEGSHSGTITHTASGGNYTGLSIASVTATITDNDVGSVVVTPSGGSTDVTEGGATDTYTLVLGAAPAGSVTITITPDSQVVTSPTPSVTFTNADWNVPPSSVTFPPPTELFPVT